MLKTLSIAEVQNIAVHGRTTACRMPLMLFWSASSIKMNLKGSEVWVEFETDYVQYEQWASIVLNGAHIARFPLQKGRVWMPILRNLHPEKIHRIEIVRDCQAMSADDASFLQIHALRIDGELMPLEPKALKLEVIGDSITCASGAIGAKQENDWRSVFLCATRGYAYLTAQLLQADLRVIGQSGWGTLCSWDNDPNCAVPKYYEQICGVVKGERNAALGAGQPNDFVQWNADVVVINLGTNDTGAFRALAWRDPVTGELFKMRSNEDGTRNAQDEQTLKEAMYDFLTVVRKYNPRAHILWVHGMMTNELSGVIQTVITKYRADMGDAKAEYFQLNGEPAEGTDAFNHPGLLRHQAAAEMLAEKIATL